MPRSAVLEHESKSKRDPYVGQLTHKLMMSVIEDQAPGRGDHWTLITRILNFAAEAEQQIVNQKRRISQLETLSRTDELTGLGNRRAFEDFMRRTLAAARRYDETGLTVFLDLDGFKAINDTYGHLAGDEVLRRVATHLSERIRESDLVARLGGDEFVIALTRCAPDQGLARAAMIERSLNRLTVAFENQQIRIRASFGHAPYGPDSSYEDVIAEADRVMFRTKRRRRSRS